MNSQISFVITGHIDHGKSTFVGRLLLDLGVIPNDKIENLKRQAGQQKLEYAHLTDALADEKKRGITIGVSRILFSYAGREFVFVDAPGHFEFIQNMISGASRADLAFLLVDISEGIRESTLRHLQMLSFLGVSEITVIANKMDLVQYSESAFLSLSSKLEKCFADSGLEFKKCIPVSAYHSENLVSRSAQMPWYSGPLVQDVLCALPPNKARIPESEMRFVVHDVFKENVFGELISGQLNPDHTYQVHKKVPQNSFTLRELPGAFQGERLKTCALPACGLKRGDIVTTPSNGLLKSREFTASLIWFSGQSLSLEKPICLRLGKQEVSATINCVHSVIDSSSLLPVPVGASIQKGQLAKADIRLDHEISYDLFENDSTLGRFVILHDGLISGAGKIIPH